MILSKETVKSIFHGAVRFTEEEEGWLGFYRMTEKQFKAEEAHGHLLPCSSASGMFIEMEGDIEKIEFDYRLSSTTKKCFQYTLDVLEDGNLTYSVAGDQEEDVYGHFSYEPKYGKRITVRFPWRKQIRLKNVAIEGEWKPAERKIKALILGDSITHGTWGNQTSLTYASQMSDILRLDSVCQAIGGDAFYTEVPDEDLPFDPDVITVAYGTNDYSLHQNCVENCGAYFEKLRRIYPDKPIVYFLPIYRFFIEDKEEIRGFSLEEARGRYKAQAEKYGVRVVNARDFIPRELQFYKDGLHPNTLGFAVMGPRYAEALRKAVPELFGKDE